MRSIPTFISIKLFSGSKYQIFWEWLSKQKLNATCPREHNSLVYHSLVFCRVRDFLFWNELNIFVFQGFPAVIVAISLGATQAVGYGSSEACWLDVKSGVVWAFIGPAILIISVSGYSIVLCFTSYQWKVQSIGCSDRKQIVSIVFSGLKSKMEKNQFWMFGFDCVSWGELWRKGSLPSFFDLGKLVAKISILSHPCSFLTNTD